MYARLKGKDGFTMTELVIVAAVLGLMAAVAIPNIISWIPTMRANSSIRNLASEMQLARMQAVSERNNYVITFDTTNHEYTIHDDNDSDGNLDETGAAATNGDETSKGPISLSTDIQFGYVAGQVGTAGTTITSAVTFSGTSETFEPDGTATNNGSVYLIPTQDISISRKDRQRAITVIQTGRVKVWRYNSGESPPWK